MKWQILDALSDWKTERNRKVLLLRGARQVGKTYIVRELSKKYEHFVEVNFESNTDIHSFFDEIQSCPKAFQALRFFYESKPGLHVIAAGSLLEFVLSDLSSWGVGRIRSLYMYPMSFDEFLMANKEDALIEMKQEASAEKPIIPAFHEKLK